METIPPLRDEAETIPPLRDAFGGLRRPSFCKKTNFRCYRGGSSAVVNMAADTSLQPLRAFEDFMAETGVADEGRTTASDPGSGATMVAIVRRPVTEDEEDSSTQW